MSVHETDDTPADVTAEAIIARVEVDDATARWWYTFGYRAGHAEGYAAAEADLDAEWAELTANVHQHERIHNARWSLRVYGRWQGRTRDTFADPRPGDHPGGMNPPAASYGCAHDWWFQRPGTRCRGCGEVIP